MLVTRPARAVTFLAVEGSSARSELTYCHLRASTLTGGHTRDRVRRGPRNSSAAGNLIFGLSSRHTLLPVLALEAASAIRSSPRWANLKTVSQRRKPTTAPAAALGTLFLPFIIKGSEPPTMGKVARARTATLSNASSRSRPRRKCCIFVVTNRNQAPARALCACD